jgi:hypothetical protein
MPADTEIHLRTVPPPGINPHGIWIRLCTKERLITAHALDSLPIAGLAGTEDGALTAAELDRGHDCWLYIYDGDNGKCIGTLIAYTKNPITKSSAA